MEKPMNQSIYRFLVLCEILASTSAGIFGNKVADLISISPTWVLAGSVFMILLLFFVTVQRLQYENDKENSSFGRIFNLGYFPKEVTRREVFVFPIALLLGILIGFISTTLFPTENFFILQTRWFGQYRFMTWHDYEVLSYLFVAITIYFVNRNTKDVVLVFIFSIAYSIGLLGTFLLYRPGENDISNIVLNFSVIMIFTALVRSKAVEVFFSDVQSLWKKLTEDQKAS